MLHSLAHTEELPSSTNAKSGGMLQWNPTSRYSNKLTLLQQLQVENAQLRHRAVELVLVIHKMREERESG